MKQELIERYVAGQLGEAEAEAFEDYCVANPEFAQLVEYEQRLRAGIVQVASGSAAEFARSNQQRPWHLAAGAAALVAVIGILFTWSRFPRANASHILAAASHDDRRGSETLRLARVRGSETVPALKSGQVRLEIVGLFDPDSRYTVALDRHTSANEVESVSKLDDQHPSSAMSLEVLLDGDQLEPGTYSLRVSEESSRGEDLEFELVKP